MERKETMENKIYWMRFFDFMWYKLDAEKAHARCNEARDKLDRTGIIDQSARKEIERNLADLRNKTALVKTEVSKYAIKLNKEKRELREELKWTYKNITEQKDNMKHDIELHLAEDSDEYEGEQARVEEMESHIQTHIRICNFYKTCYICDRADAKRMDTMLSIPDTD